MFSFCACSEDEVIDGIPQQNEQLPQMTTDAVTPSIVIVDGQSIDLANAQGENIEVINIADIVNLPADNELAVEMRFANNAEMNGAQILAVELVDVESESILKTGTINADEWDNAYKAVLGKNPMTRTGYIVFDAYAVKGGSKIYLGAFTDVVSIAVTPYPSPIFIDEAYSLEVNGEIVSELNHTGDVYDNPVFTLKLDISADDVMNGWEWRVLAKSYVDGNTTMERTVFAPSDDFVESAEGELVTNVAGFEPQTGILNVDGELLLTVNVETLTFAFTSTLEQLYTPGGANGWNGANSQILYTNNYTDYEGYAVLDPGGFKFTTKPDWSGRIYGGVEGVEGVLSVPGENLTVDVKGLYWCKVNIPSLTYSVTHINSIGVIGDTTPGGWDTDTDLTSEDFLVWKGTVALKGTGELKFRANDGWDINLGGDVNDLSAGGANIPTPGEGNWEVVLDLSKLPYSCSFTKK